MKTLPLFTLLLVSLALHTHAEEDTNLGALEEEIVPAIQNSGWLDATEREGFNGTGLSFFQELATASSTLPHHRSKRFFGFPEGSNLEAKWSLNFPFDTFTFYKAKFQLGVPIKIPFPAAIIVGGKKKKRAVEEAEGRNTLLEEHALRRKEARQERLQIYDYLEGVLETAGLSGRSCLLRAICEVAEAPFDQGMVGEMVNTLLTASVAGRPSKEEEEEEEALRYHLYLQAELQGRLEGRCGETYARCEKSPFDLLPNVVHMVL